MGTTRSLPAFAQGAHHAAPQVQLLEGQAHQLRDPEARGIEHLQEGLVPQAPRGAGVRGGQQRRHFRLPHHLGQPLGQAGRVQQLHGIGRDLLLPLQEAEKLPQGGEAPGPAAGRQPPGFLGGEIVLQVGEINRGPVASGPALR